jgi:hypothetical protein
LGATLRMNGREQYLTRVKVDFAQTPMRDGFFEHLTLQYTSLVRRGSEKLLRKYHNILKVINGLAYLVQKGEKGFMAVTLDEISCEL